MPKGCQCRLRPLLPQANSTVFGFPTVLLALWCPLNLVVNVVPQHRWLMDIQVGFRDSGLALGSRCGGIVVLEVVLGVHGPPAASAIVARA